MDVDPLILAVFGPPPDGINLNENQRFGHDVSVVVLLVIATVGVALRLAARIVQKSGLKADDYAIIVALMLGFGTGGLSIAGGNFAAGRHIWATKMNDFVTMMKILYSYTYIYAAAVATTKVSILLFYRRIFGFEGKVWRISLTTGAVLTASYPLIIWLTMASCCKPVSHFWSRFVGSSGTCIDINTFFLALGIINMLIDIIVLVIPIPKILALNMTPNKKLGICGIFLLGSL
ncbi:hypothetical protein TruAng_000849 [Truncatella angustata]|nr:hypothetical protein TruAng_000849 [Truncatella angustata]